MKQFVILANQRSGSTFLYKLLDSNPEIFCMDEIFRLGANTKGNFTYYVNETYLRYFLFKISANRYIQKAYPDNQILRYLIHRFLNSIKIETNKNKLYQVFGYKLMYNQFNYYQSLSKWILENNVYVIHLIRQNALKIHLSWLTRIKRDVPHSTGYVDSVKVFVDPGTIIKVLEEIVIRQESFKYLFLNKFKNNPYIEVAYEELNQNYQIPIQELIHFLKIKNKKFKTPKLKKLNPDSVQSIIENYDDVYNQLINTKFQKYLD